MHEDRGNECHDRDARNAREQTEHGFTDIAAVADIVERHLELLGDRVIHVGCHEFQRCGEWMAGLERALHDVDRIRQLLLEFAHALDSILAEFHKRQIGSCTGGKKRNQGHPGRGPRGISTNDAENNGYRDETVG